MNELEKLKNWKAGIYISGRKIHDFKDLIHLVKTNSISNTAGSLIVPYKSKINYSAALYAGHNDYWNSTNSIISKTIPLQLGTAYKDVEDHLEYIVNKLAIKKVFSWENYLLSYNEAYRDGVCLEIFKADDKLYLIDIDRIQVYYNNYSSPHIVYAIADLDPTIFLLEKKELFGLEKEEEELEEMGYGK